MLDFFFSIEWQLFILLRLISMMGIIVWRNKQFLRTQNLVNFKILLYTVMSVLETFLIA